MSYSSEDETDISDSELDDYVDRCYEQLKDGKSVKYSNVLFRCPYCPGKKKLVYHFKDLFQHASDVAKGSANKDIKHKGKHLGLVKYMKNDLEQEQEDLSSELSRLKLEQDDVTVDELFVWPWMGILANVDAESISISTIKNDLAKRGFDPIRVRQLSSGGSKYAVVEFKKEWSGFYKAIMFEKEFEVCYHGKKDYLRAPPHLTDDKKMYGWIARDDDYNSEGILGDYLKKNGDLKTIGDLEAYEKRKTNLLVSNLTKTIEELKTRVDELERTAV